MNLALHAKNRNTKKVRRKNYKRIKVCEARKMVEFASMRVICPKWFYTRFREMSSYFLVVVVLVVVVVIVL